MGFYAEYLDAGLGGNFERLTVERKKQLKAIARLRERDVLVYAAAIDKSKLPIGISYPDILPLTDQLSNLTKSKREGLDLILETPGGSGETVEDIVRLIRERYPSFAVIVPGMAKSAGTLLAMAADEILMDGTSSLGPIDAQITWQGKTFSAHALIEGMDKIKAEVLDKGALNKAYVPMLQNISPGELQHAQNALDFAREMVTKWLVNYKFKNWHVHSSTGKEVTDASRRARADEIAAALCNQGLWKTHGRSIKIDELRRMRLQITDYSDQPELAEAIRRYHTLAQMTFSTRVYKMFETAESQILRTEAVQTGQVMPLPAPKAGRELNAAQFKARCAKCGTDVHVEARLNDKAKPTPGLIQFPSNNLLKCPNAACDNVMDLSTFRQQIEAQSKRKVL